MTLPQGNPKHPQHQRKREAENTSWLSSPSTSNITTGLKRAALRCPSSSSSPPGCQQALVLCRASTLGPRPQPSSLTLRALSSHPPPPSDCSPCFQLSCGHCCQHGRAISRQSCSHCSAKQHRQGTRCDTSSRPAFGKYLQPSEKTDIVLVAVEAMTDSSIYDKEEASSILHVAMREPASWLTEVSGLWLPCPALEPFSRCSCLPPCFPPSLPNPGASGTILSHFKPQSRMGRAAVSEAAEEMAALQWQHHPHLCALQVPNIMRCIYENMECIGMASARHSLDLLLLLMTDQCPREVVTSLLKLSPSCDRY
ncbi:hypothetical protein QYF61_014794 [Mycteria americana]|uniref:Maestro-like HEAT-repeats domain-containing protein n=1 Tax=Mycteria americana TaxID=33587 RepID=A0AAN7NDA8_MYCAM|nr:hypothetical protein QYF61_009706 [Mycteria americana]KAK4809471.1 hypothetical protein QYF61_014783 [Mycteria americana]KAK4809475.1 hypothetical protein QYF61_014787 [Mycteria americana]KAK4809480.1 hypothetical protein QYF61_014792 [Mycteria americana]KAK4809482.1 hypothetical protein QYF61_014794 [Mycteria americana]